jgi:hypothetical protein
MWYSITLICLCNRQLLSISYVSVIVQLAYRLRYKMKSHFRQGGWWIFFFLSRCSYRLWGLPNLLSNGQRGLLPRGQSVRDVKLTTHIHLIQTLGRGELYLHSLKFLHGVLLNCGSQWPRGLRQVLSSAARTLGSQFRILLGAWMCVCVSLCCVVLCR